MAHEIESMFFAGEVPWHKLGVKVHGAVTSEEAIRAAKLDWEVELEPLYTGESTLIKTHRAARRSTDGKILGVVGKGYTILQNRDAFEWFDPFVQAGEATYETAGSLRGGSRIWILAKLNRPDAVIVPQSDDRVVKYVLLANSHDSSLTCRGGYTPTRVVCANTLSAAINGKASQLFKLRHTARIVENLETVRETMNLADATFEATAEQYRRLAGAVVNNRKQLESYVRAVFNLDDVPAGEGTKGADDGKSRERLWPAVEKAFETGRGNDLPGVKNTWWAAYNAVTDYLSHDRGKDAAGRLDSQWLGASAQTNARALQYAYQYVTQAAA